MGLLGLDAQARAGTFGATLQALRLSNAYHFFDFLYLGFYILGIASFVLNAARITGLRNNLAQGFFS